MGARILVVDAASRAIGALFAQELAAEIEAQQPEDTGHGYMEYFDWLAGTSNVELNALYEEHCQARCVDLDTNPHARERVGLAVWNSL